MNGNANKYNMPPFKLLAYSECDADALHIGHCANEVVANTTKIRSNRYGINFFIDKVKLLNKLQSYRKLLLRNNRKSIIRCHENIY